MIDTRSSNNKNSNSLLINTTFLIISIRYWLSEVCVAGIAGWAIGGDLWVKSLCILFFRGRVWA